MTGADVALVADAIRRELGDGKWHGAVGLGGWDVERGVRGAALNRLLEGEVIEWDTARGVYRLVKQAQPQQTSIYENAP